VKNPEKKWKIRDECSSNYLHLHRVRGRWVVRRRVAERKKKGGKKKEEGVGAVSTSPLLFFI